MELTIEQRVARGAELLNGLVPGWTERIDVNTLDIKLGDRCVLGQVFSERTEDYGAYYRGLDTLLVGDFGADYGFHVLEACNYSEWEALTNEWKRVLAELKNA